MEELYQEIPHITAQPSRLIPERDKIIGGIQKNPHLLFEEQMVWVNPLKESKAYYRRIFPLLPIEAIVHFLSLTKSLIYNLPISSI